MSLALAYWLLALAIAPGSGSGPGPTGVHEILIDVDGAKIRALCTDGRRQALLLHGSGATADSWLPVLERLDGQIGACAYDRRGNGRSLPVPEARGWFELLDEIRRIHLALGFDSDYVVAGHGIGGLYARLFAIDRPRDLAGLILVDPAHEDLPDRIRTGMPVAEWNIWADARRTPNDDGVTEVEVGERLRGRRLPQMLVTVITAGIRRDGEGWTARFVNEGYRQAHASILQGITGARHIPASRSRHDVHLDDPSLVTAEILRTVETVRR
ncbi:MAG: alpha/beta fold hydrolase [Gemmatimonadetes bacterium]|nr:alpha/beta fold hydrolase [Gemmatimonadota bacterium]MDA1103443.1 alpha/beta fold hydrolase [Gemmatimonadota bacterium]